MQFFFPDSQDQISPEYDFRSDTYPTFRVRQRDDLYAHETLAGPPMNGVLVSKAMVDSTGDSSSRYSMSQRHRLYRSGVHDFFRLDLPDGRRLTAMGDCGAFTYFRDDVPPFTVDEVIDFYDECDFDWGVSVDHVILAFQSDENEPDPDWVRRRDLTIDLAAEFLKRHHERNCRFEPLGTAQGWSPTSIAQSVAELQKIGYRRIAVGGLVPLKTTEVLDCLSAINDQREPTTQLHLLGITRCENVHEFASFGVTSFDSTSPFRQAFMDDRDNYWTINETFTALRVPQVDGNPSLKRRIRAGQIDQGEAVRLEKECLQVLAAFDHRETTVEETVSVLRAYEVLYDQKSDHSDEYRRTLEARPWDDCACGICDTARIDAAIFRGTERNKRRGFHNLHVFRQRLDHEISLEPTHAKRQKPAPTQAR